MDTARLFSLSFTLVAPFWFLMIVLPFWSWTKRIISSPFIAIGPAIIYLLLVVPRLESIWTAVTSPTLTGIATLLSSPEGATIGWAHFLAFDVFTGRWIYLDSRERGINGFIIAPVLFMTIMLGPIGYLLYLGVRTVHQFLPRPSRAAKVEAV